MNSLNLSINKIIEELKGNDKIYLTNYKDSGYELGFGKGGYYKGHSHYFFYDILFSTNIFFIENNTKYLQNNFLLVVPPKTFLNDIIVDDFFFIKFCPTDDLIILPDKTNEILNENKLELYNSPTSLEFRWFKNPKEKNKISLIANSDYLQIILGNRERINIFI